MISASDRGTAITLINEAVEAGARLSRACEILMISERTYRRWAAEQEANGISEDKQPCADHSNPDNRIPDEGRRKIIETCNSPEYAGMAPCEIVPALADKGEYIASESTFYRVLREEEMNNHRGRAAAPNRNHPTTYYATAPNQVWMWDITCLNGPHRGFFYYLYLFSDLFDRSVVGWEVYEEENAEHASELIRRISLAQGRLTTQPLVLHSDNGSLTLASGDISHSIANGE